MREHTDTHISNPATSISGFPPFSATFPIIIVMPTTELFVVNSAGVAKKVSKLSARFDRYKKQIAAGGMDPPYVSVNLSHPAVIAARQRICE